VSLFSMTVFALVMFHMVLLECGNEIKLR